MDPDKRSAWLQKLDQECPYQITLPRRQLTDDSAIMDFLLSSHVGKLLNSSFVLYRFDDKPRLRTDHSIHGNVG